MRLSIQPKQSASRLTSSTTIDFWPVCALWRTTHTPALDAWFDDNHTRHLPRFATSRNGSDGDFTPRIAAKMSQRVMPGTDPSTKGLSYCKPGEHQWPADEKPPFRFA